MAPYLPDFDDFRPIQEVKEAMGAYGRVELGEVRWTALQIGGIEVDPSELDISEDRLLTYQGQQVLVFIRDQYLTPQGERPEGYRFHLAHCKTLARMWAQNKKHRYVATNRSDGLFLVNFKERGSGDVVYEMEEWRLPVCKNCLERLEWEGYSRGLEKWEREEIVEDFDIAAFFEEYGGSLVEGYR